MNCKLCGKHLYENITFRNLFKFNYNVHYKCEQLLRTKEDYIAYPLLDKLVYIDYLFEESHEESDREFLYDKYSAILFNRFLDNSDWSIVIILDRILDTTTIILTLKMADKALLILSVFNESFM